MRTVIVIIIGAMCLGFGWVALHQGKAKPEVQVPVVCGAVDVPSTWGTFAFELRLQKIVSSRDLPGSLDAMMHVRVIRRAEMRVDPERPSRFWWDFGHVDAGRYQIWCPEFTIIKEVNVGDRETEWVKIEVPEAADVAVVLVQEDDTPAIDPCSVELSWCLKQKMVDGSNSEPGIASWDKSNGVFRFRAPAGEIEFAIWNHEVELVGDSVFPTKVGQNTVTLNVRRSSGVVLYLSDPNGNPVSVEDGSYQIIARSDDDAEWDWDTRTCSFDDHVMITVKKPGKTLLRIPSSEVLATEEQTLAVDVPRGEFVLRRLTLKAAAEGN